MKLFIMISLYHTQFKLLSNFYMYASTKVQLVYNCFYEYLDDYNINISIESVCKVLSK